MAQLKTTVTYLEMTEPSGLAGGQVEDPGVTLVEVRHCTNSYYLYLYTEVGREYNWV